MARSDPGSAAVSVERPSETLGEADLPGCLALSQEAGWNQTAADWRVFLRDGRVHGLRDAAGALIATGASLPYQGFGFVSMVLVTAQARRQGHATRLLRQALADLTAQRLVPMLDATPEGARLYAREGFVPVFDFARYRLDRRPTGQPRGGMPELSDVVALDALACGSHRAGLIGDFAARPATRLCGTTTGFALAREGRQAVQIGPLAAGSETEATVLLEHALAGLSGPVVIDVPDEQRGFRAHLCALGFSEARRFTRMTLGRHAPFGQASRRFALAGPEFG